MPSSEEIFEAQGNIANWAECQLKREGHSPNSAKEILKRMTYDEKVEKAELWKGEKIYRGAYSPY